MRVKTSPGGGVSHIKRTGYLLAILTKRNRYQDAVLACINFFSLLKGSDSTEKHIDAFIIFHSDKYVLNEEK